MVKRIFIWVDDNPTLMQQMPMLDFSVYDFWISPKDDLYHDYARTVASNIYNDHLVLAPKHSGRSTSSPYHDDVIKWKYFPRYWTFVRRIHRSSVNSPHIGQWRTVAMLSLTCAWTNSWANNGDTCDLRRHRAHYDVSVMFINNYRKELATLDTRFVVFSLEEFINSCIDGRFINFYQLNRRLLAYCNKDICFVVWFYTELMFWPTWKTYHFQ